MIYISGKISGEDLQESRAKFKEAEDQLKKEGHSTVNPMEMIEVEEHKTWEDYMREAIYLQMACAEIFMLKDWADSRGAKIEHSLAKTLKYKIRYQ